MYAFGVISNLKDRNFGTGTRVSVECVDEFCYLGDMLS
jgi:hypothetical protein